MKGLVISFDLEKFKYHFRIVNINKGDGFRQFAKLIDCNYIDAVEYDERYDIVVDDEGLLISNNPVLEIETPLTTYQLAGKLLIVKKRRTARGIAWVGMSDKEVENLIYNLKDKIRLIGVTQ